MSFLDRIRECNKHDLANFRPFVVAGQRMGSVRHAFAERLSRFPDTFDVVREAVRLSDRLDSFRVAQCRPRRGRARARGKEGHQGPAR